VVELFSTGVLGLGYADMLEAATTARLIAAMHFSALTGGATPGTKDAQ
jgi:hypothetical protein